MPEPRLPPSLARILDRRVVLVTGKGGVGKTTLTAALARLATRTGRRVLVGELGGEVTGPSPLRQALTGVDAPLVEEPTPLGPGLDAVRVTAAAGHRDFLRGALPLGFLAERALRADVLQRFLNGAPGFAELGMLYRGLSLEREKRHGAPRWDLVLLDAPASGHALALATLPAVALRLISAGPIARALGEGVSLLTDPERTCAVVATVPEALPVSEAMELVTGLEKAGVAVGGLVANLVPPDPFSLEEHALLDALVGAGEGARAQLLGRRSVDALRRARAALARLEGAGRSLLPVSWRADSGPALVDVMARELAPA
jgi:arsenite-transporting ATPase